MKTIGLDIGSNSVGSCWIDDKKEQLHLGVSIFPAGVETSEKQRGAPKNQKRREARSQRRSIHRRAKRKRQLQEFLVTHGLLPADSRERQELFNTTNPWHLRRDALGRELTPHEFGRLLMHLIQRRGALGVTIDSDDPDEGKVKEAIERTIEKLGGRTFGQMMADLFDEDTVPSTSGTPIHNAIRNRRDSFRFHADRNMTADEFNRVWEKQNDFDGPLAKLLTTELKLALFDPSQTNTWRHRGLIFGQRATYWDAGTLGRCDLEPTEHRCPKADMIAQEFLVIESVNNIRLGRRGESEMPLDDDQRTKVIAALRTAKTASPATIRKALGLNKQTDKTNWTLNVERDSERVINTDWFYRSIVVPSFGEEDWQAMTDAQRKSVNMAILKFDPATEADVTRLREGAQKWWGLDDDSVDALVEGWRTRPKLESRIKLSRRALQNLMPMMREQRMSLTEARKEFARRLTHADSTPELTRQIQRYELSGRPLNKAERVYLDKHPDQLPPAPYLSNPVVRKAVHEVRRHLNEYLRRFGRPDRVVVELAREARQSEAVRNRTLATNRTREKQRKAIIDQFNLHGESTNQQNRAIERVLLCRQQNGKCPYTLATEQSDSTISEAEAVSGVGLEVDHIVPRSRSHDNGINNKVLVRREANRDKANKTIKEWLGADSDAFKRLLASMEHIKAGVPTGKYFTKKDYKRKWQNLTRDAPSTESFANSQLTDTAYASTQVLAYIKEALWSEDQPVEVISTKGRYTAILRNDWGLGERAIEREFSRDDGLDDAADSLPKKPAKKDRSDHIHHAVDAVAIAYCTGATIQQIARYAQQQELARSKEGAWPRRQTIDPPWGNTVRFRGQVIDAAKRIAVSHRPVKRRLVGAFHEETLYGPVLEGGPSHRTEDASKLFTNRLSIERLSANHLRVPDGWDELIVALDKAKPNEREIRKVRRRMSQLADPPPAKSGIVRDRELRTQLRESLRRRRINPDKFTTTELKKVLTESELCLPSGVPVRSVVLLRTITEPVIMARKVWSDSERKMVPDIDDDGLPNSRTRRVYVGGNNHHVELRQHPHTGKWSGEFVTTFDAARRVRIQKQNAVDRQSNDDGEFMLSLAEGEMIRARPRGTDPDDDVKDDLFVIAKLDRTRNRVVFAPHWDARPASEQARWEATPAQLKELGPVPGQPIVKVLVSPLGEIREIQD